MGLLTGTNGIQMRVDFEKNKTDATPSIDIYYCATTAQVTNVFFKCGHPLAWQAHSDVRAGCGECLAEDFGSEVGHARMQDGH